jgi:HK97 family phage prohead protease
VRPVIFGLATAYNEVVYHHGEYKLLLPGVFTKTLTSGATVELLRDHQPSEYIGSTNDILYLFDDSNTGLAFRVSRLPNTELGAHVRYMATDAKYDSVSVGFDYNGAKKLTRRIDGIDVVCVVEADLQEVSICSGYDAGTCKQAFVTYGECQNLQHECRKGRLVYEGAAVQLRRTARRFLINN